MTIAAFDFDGTITQKDTMFAFIRFVKGDIRFLLGLFWLSPILILHKMGLLSAQKTKEKFLSFFFQNETEKEMYEKGNQFCQEKLPNLIRPQALECIKAHQEKGHKCYLVTASLTFWTQKWAAENHLTLLATIPATENGRFTGKIAGKNCNGAEKVNRLLAAIESENIEKRYAYGDTKGDAEMLKWADESIFKPFRTIS